MILYSKFGVPISLAKKKVGKVVPSEKPVEVERT